MKFIKFLIGGGVAATINIFLIHFMIEHQGFNTPFLKNLANVIALEASLVASFFLYRVFVWTGGTWNSREVFFKQLPLYHVSAGAAVFLRIFILFPLLDWLSVNYLINTLVGISFSAIINFFLTDRYVFTSSNFPESLSPSLHPSKVIYPDHSKLNPIRNLSIVIPAYNEEGSISATIQDIENCLSQECIDYEILVVNDNSKDRTEVILKDLTQKSNRVRYINNYYPNGFGFAVRCGLENFHNDAVVIVMADGSDDPRDIINYYRKIANGYDCAFGSRFIKGGKVIDYPVYKLIINRLANLFIQVMFGLKYNDVTNAFKMYRKSVIEGVSPLLSHHFNLTVEIPLKAIVRGYSYSVLPITWRNRKTGTSKLKLREMGSRYLFIVLYIWLEKHLSRGDYHVKSNFHSSKSKVINNE